MKKFTLLSSTSSISAMIVMAICVLVLVGCLGVPDNIKPVTNFKAEKYLGTWYEIARLDYSHERGMNQVSATYSLNSPDEIKVVNRGYLTEKSQWRETEGKAFFVEGKDKAYLKVSFWGPFYSSYIVFYLDDNYQYSLVTGSDKSYLWILARTPTISGEIKADLIAKAAALGFDTNKLVFVEQTEIPKTQ